MALGEGSGKAIHADGTRKLSDVVRRHQASGSGWETATVACTSFQHDTLARRLDRLMETAFDRGAEVPASADVHGLLILDGSAQKATRSLRGG